MKFVIKVLKVGIIKDFMNSVFIFGVVVIFFICASGQNNIVFGDELNPGLFSINSKPYGSSYGEWIEKYWQWWLSIPQDKHPGQGYTPDKCNAMQEGPVWFLPNVIEDDGLVRECTVPYGKAIFVALATGECDEGIEGISHTDKGLIDCASEGQRETRLTARIDGVPVKDVYNYRTKSAFFNVTIPEDHTLIYDDLKPGTFRAFAEGYVLFLEPLSVGKHTIDFSANERFSGMQESTTRNVKFGITVPES